MLDFMKRMERAVLIRPLLAMALLIHFTRLVYGQNHLEVSGPAYIQDQLILSPVDPNGGEYLQNTDGLTLSFFSAYQERMKINNDGSLTMYYIPVDNGSSQNLLYSNSGRIVKHQYSVGDMAHGGIIFYVDPSGEHGLVAAEFDLESAPGDSLHQWTRDNEWIETGAEGIDSVIGMGLLNTASIIVSNYMNLDNVALHCANFQSQNYGDWYLPSYSELRIMFQGLIPMGLGNIKELDWYWSSSESSNIHAWALQNYNGYPTGSGKGKANHYRVRPIRKF